MQRNNFIAVCSAKTPIPVASVMVSHSILMMKTYLMMKYFVLDKALPQRRRRAIHFSMVHPCCN